MPGTAMMRRCEGEWDGRLCSIWGQSEAENAYYALGTVLDTWHHYCSLLFDDPFSQ